MPVVRTLRVRVDRVQFSAARPKGRVCPMKILFGRVRIVSVRAYSKVVLRGIRIAEARVRFSLGPQKQGAVISDYVFCRMPQFLLWRHKCVGPVAHLVERLHGMHEARGSIPLGSTRFLLQ